MDRRIRHIALLLTLLLLAIAMRSGWVQGIRAEEIATYEPPGKVNPEVRTRNQFRIFQECRWERGDILSADGQVLAETVPAEAGRRCQYERRYPQGELVPHIVGQWSLHFGKTGLEAAYNKELVGEPAPPETLAEFFSERPRIGNNLVSTLDTRLQAAALSALGGRRGGVVALNPATGAVLAAASNPTYNPDPLASNDRSAAVRARCALGLGVRLTESGQVVRDAEGQPVPCENPKAPLVSVALQGRRPPGSSFKVVTAAAALESGKYKPTRPSLPVRGAYTAPRDTRAIGNFGGGSCGGNLTAALTVSCNTAFAEIAVDVGADQLLKTAHAMGLDRGGQASLRGCESEPSSDIAETRTGCLPSELVERDSSGKAKRQEKLSTAGFRARAGFGQWVLQVSPFGMATVAATIANGGFVPQPRFGEKIIDRTGRTVRDIRTALGPQAMSSSSAEAVGGMMRSVVTSGTAARAFSGFPIPVAGKTGTAQQPSCAKDEQAIFGRNCGRLPHAWFIAYAPVKDPAIAIAVLVERGGGNNEEATGGQVAAPIARKVLEACFGLPGTPCADAIAREPGR
ncbi:MAG TPA: penicillin-binding transpeptidase domain-containing protein [Actinomycetota bacterium]|nr:penicillin-binding transpeptidase domain-containing protein [Actinomycetota bacterium]